MAQETTQLRRLTRQVEHGELRPDIVEAVMLRLQLMLANRTFSVVSINEQHSRWPSIEANTCLTEPVILDGDEIKFAVDGWNYTFRAAEATNRTGKTVWRKFKFVGDDQFILEDYSPSRHLYTYVFIVNDPAEAAE